VFGAERSVSELSTRTQAQRESRSVQMEFNRRGGWKPVQGGAAKASRPQGGIMGTLSERQRALHRTFLRAKKGGASERFTFPADELHAGFCTSIYEFHPAFICTFVIACLSISIQKMNVEISPLIYYRVLLQVQ